MLDPKAFATWLEKQAADECGYIMCAVGQDPKTLSDWYYTGQYSGKQLDKAYYWRDHAPRVYDCQGLADCYVSENVSKINVRARNNYADWCGIRGEGTIPDARKTEGAAVFRMGKSYIEHVGFLVRPCDPSDREGDWLVVEAKGVMYGVVTTRLSKGSWNRWGWMTKYFSYAERPESTTQEYGSRTLKRGCTGSDVRALQADLIALGYSCGSYGADGDFGKATESAVKAFQHDHSLTEDGIAGEKTFAQLLKLLPESAEETAEEEQPETITVAPGTWRIRSMPSMSGATLGYVHGADVLTRGELGWDGIEHQWLNVIYNDESAWIGAKGVAK